MRWFVILTLGVALGACGHHKKDDDGDETTDAAAPSTGTDVAERDNSGTSNSVPVAGVQPGSNSSAGGTEIETGGPSSPGLPGPPGPIGGVVLYDSENRQIGVKLHDDVGSVAHVVLSDHRYAMIDQDTGELVPLLDLTCLYEANDCTGSCFVSDKRWLNLVLEDPRGATWVANRSAANLGAKMLKSYGTAGGECIANAIGTRESYLAEPYTLPTGLSLPFAAPLRWDLSN